ncbi:MAG: CHAT domain-containing protein, partial [Gammaproteobacteria bacterium]
DFKAIAVSRWQGLFNLRDYLRHYVDKGNEAASVAEIGVCIAEEVLGEEIFRMLWASESQRTLRIQLPGATKEENHLAAALARVPWEMARPAADRPTLGERNLLVRVVHDMADPNTQPLELGQDECLRVLFVFAEARGSRPLAARLERRELRKLFDTEVYPQRRIVAHFLTHGVTRERLQAQIQENGGYHIVHWSGHGDRNLLELAKTGGAQDHLSGEDLLDLFVKAGGFLPRLCFLSACHSGDILRVKDWNDFLAVAEGKEPGTKDAPASETKDMALDRQPGYTGTAHALLQGGVSSVVAMRYAVNDDYARDLGVEFYRALLAHPQPKTAAAALTMARRSLLDPKKHDPVHYFVCDHATPVLYGAEQPGLCLPKGRSPALDTRDPRLHAIAELTTAGHEHFVGRTWELAGLGADFIGSTTSAEVKPVAVITGLGGMGKTALVAEALGLWESRFDRVLLYQAKPNVLGVDRDFLWNMHVRLIDKSDAYRSRIAANSRDAIWLAAEGDFTGQRRFDVMLENLVAVFRAYSILLVLDNFETNLKPQSEPGNAAEPLWACQDPAWDRCLSQLATELVGKASRVLITSRRPLAALAGTTYHSVLLGPLPSGEAALYLREHAGLRRMVFSGDAGEKALALRLLNASRFHPLLMDRLARLATGGPALCLQLMQALTALESSHDYAHLPALFVTGPGDAKELTYLNDALATSLDQLIRDADPDARRLLWVIAVANDPVSLSLLQSVCGAAPARPDPAPLLRHLVAVGLVTEERAGPHDENPDLTCHELVRERTRDWMRDHPRDRGELTENTIRLAYADRLEAVFTALQHQNTTAALEAGSRALVYCVEAQAYDRLCHLASGVVTSTRDPRLLVGLLPHLEAAAESAPEGEPRWSCLGSLAVALAHGGRPDASLHFFEQAATLAEAAAAEASGETARRAWASVAVTTGNWANALGDVGHLDAARQRRLESAEASNKAGDPAVAVIANELEVLRIDIKQGRVAQVLPHVEARLAQVESWWQQHRAGEFVPEAPDPEFLARALIAGLAIAREAHYIQENWESALRRIDGVLTVKRALGRAAKDIASSRLHRANVLNRLGRFDAAKAEMEDCLDLLQDDPAQRADVFGFLAQLFYRQGDVAQAITQERRALALSEQLPDPRDRAISHNNLAMYLASRGTLCAVAESIRHQLAALIYQLVAGLAQDLHASLNNYAFCIHRAHGAGTELRVPRVADLLADPAFRPLDDWLRQRQADLGDLQAAVDRFLDQARHSGLEVIP